MDGSKWHRHLKKIAIFNNFLAVIALFLAATLIYLYLQAIK